MLYTPQHNSKVNSLSSCLIQAIINLEIITNFLKFFLKNELLIFTLKQILPIEKKNVSDRIL